MRPEAHGDRGPGSVLAGVSQAFLDGAVGRPLDRVRPLQPGRQVAVQAGGQAAVVNEPGDVGEPRRRGQFVRLPAAKDANHDTELIQGSGGEVADRGGDVAGLRGGGGHPERPGLQRDQADRWETTSCISRARRLRSSASTEPASSTRSLCCASVSCRSWAVSWRRAPSSSPSAAGPSATRAA
jgi:hypothetical protein